MDLPFSVCAILKVHNHFVSALTFQQLPATLQVWRPLWTSPRFQRNTMNLQMCLVNPRHCSLHHIACMILPSTPRITKYLQLVQSIHSQPQSLRHCICSLTKTFVLGSSNPPTLLMELLSSLSKRKMDCSDYALTTVD
jgi:hypothetical protein